MSASIETLPEAFPVPLVARDNTNSSASNENLLTLAELPVGARLILRCRKDWRGATVVQITHEKITLAVHAPSGCTYRVRRPPDSPLTLDGSIPILCDESKQSSIHWRAGLARYDPRW